MTTATQKAAAPTSCHTCEWRPKSHEMPTSHRTKPANDAPQTISMKTASTTVASCVRSSRLASPWSDNTPATANVRGRADLPHAPRSGLPDRSEHLLRTALARRQRGRDVMSSLPVRLRGFTGRPSVSAGRKVWRPPRRNVGGSLHGGAAERPSHRDWAALAGHHPRRRRHRPLQQPSRPHPHRRHRDPLVDKSHPGSQTPTAAVLTRTSAQQ